MVDLKSFQNWRINRLDRSHCLFPISNFPVHPFHFVIALGSGQFDFCDMLRSGLWACKFISDCHRTFHRSNQTICERSYPFKMFLDGFFTFGRDLDKSSRSPRGQESPAVPDETIIFQYSQIFVERSSEF